MRQIVCAAALSLLAGSALARTNPYIPVPENTFTKHIACSITVDEKRIDTGKCNSNSKQESSLFVDLEYSGCTVDFSKSHGSAIAALTGYRQSCVFPKTREDVDDLTEPVVKQGRCWIGKRLRICF